MRLRATTTLLAIFLLVSTAPTTTALPAVEVENGMVFGGQWTPANTTTSTTTNLSDLTAVVEVYTATWCENCVDVEHALEDVQTAGHLQQYHIHRAIGETQDPFGSEEIDQRWRDKYGVNPPPGVVFNGTMKKVGSVADDGTLANEFTNLAQRDLGLGSGSTTFSWTPLTNSSGTVGWTLDLDQRLLENATLNVSVWVVETAADFEEGTNGLGTYPHIVHRMMGVGDALQGTAMIDLPAAFDDADLEIHLLYEIMPVIPEEPVQPTETDEESEDTPALSMFSSVLVVCLAFAFTRRGRQDRLRRD
jgi:thiol-disulfide isomerase/thioredoxin